MRITQRQLRQIIREELARGLREEDETAQGAVAMPAAKRRGIFGPRETPADEVKWNEEWGKLSQGEQDSLVAAVKGDPSFPSVVGAAVRNEDFDITRFTRLLNTPYPKGGSKAFEALVGGPTSKGRPIATAISQLASRFSGNDQRAAVFARLGARVVSGEGKQLDNIVFNNAYLVAALEQIYVGEALYPDQIHGGLKPPQEGSQLEKFFAAVLGI